MRPLARYRGMMIYCDNHHYILDDDFTSENLPDVYEHIDQTIYKDITGRDAPGRLDFIQSPSMDRSVGKITDTPPGGE